MVGIWGIVFGLWMGTFKASMNYFMIVVLGVVNLCLGAFMLYLYMTQEMYKKGYTLDYLAAIIRNNAERKEITLKAERKMRGTDPPEEK